jgi:ACS family tartrate transporter-like MFS transporter
MDAVEQRTIMKVTKRLVPFLIICYFAAYLDRVNVGFAKLEMGKALGLSETAYGLGAGIFFFTYFVFEVPSNLALERFGARKWIARIMLSWGILSGAMAFIPHFSKAFGISGESAFYIIRLLLGAAEAGFFPGIIFYLTLWFPSVYRARIVGYFMAAVPLSSVIGSPISGYLLGVRGAGMDGWQWLFIFEALPAIILSVVVFFYLTDRPRDAHWLADDERNWLTGRLEAEERQRKAAEEFSVGQALTNPRVWALALIYFGAVAANYGTAFFIPTIIKAFGVSNAQTGWLALIPYLCGMLAMIWYGHRSDRAMERKGHAAFALLVAGIGIGLAGVFDDPVIRMVCLTVGAMGVFGVLPVFWALPTAFLSGAAAAAGIAIINAVGNLAGFAGPYVMGFLKDRTGTFSAGLYAIAAVVFVAMLVVLALHHDRALERAPDRAPAE